MPMKRRIIKRPASEGLVRRVVAAAKPTPSRKQVDSLRVDAETYRTSIHNPSRSQLTKREWEERGDLMRIARIMEFEGAGALSLDDLRDVQHGINHCCTLRVAVY
jgi:hypothetical protein